jgi:hypothetical protein
MGINRMNLNPVDFGPGGPLTWWTFDLVDFDLVDY